MEIPTHIDVPWMTNCLAVAISPAGLRLFKLIGSRTRNRYQSIYLVGGSIRDLLLGETIKDFDLVIEGDAIALGQSLVSMFGGKITAHSRFGTAVWRLDHATLVRLEIPEGEHQSLFEIDLISARSETYPTPGALPIVSFGNINDDLRRRDFTINTLAVRLDGNHYGEFLDELGGLDDLRQGSIRILHSQSFIDDPTRLFRAQRYAQRYRFKVDPGTIALIPTALPEIDRLSPVRVRHELDMILLENDRCSILDQLEKYGILQQIHESLKWNQDIKEVMLNAIRLNTKNYPDLGGLIIAWTVWLMHCSSQGLEAIDKRLHLDKRTKKIIAGSINLLALAEDLVDYAPSKCLCYLDSLPLASVQIVSITSEGKPWGTVLQAYLENWRHVHPRTNARDLLDRGISPGPIIRTTLGKLRDGWVDGSIKTEKEEQEFLDRLFQDLTA